MNVQRPPLTSEIGYTEVFDLLSGSLQIHTALDKANQSYAHWEKAKYIAKANNLDERVFWKALKMRRQSNNQRLALGETFQFQLPPAIQRTLHLADMHFGGTLEMNLPPSERLKERIVISSLITEAFSSSRLEGAVSTRERAKEMIRTQQTPRDKHERMIYNNYNAMEYIRQHKAEALTEAHLFELHTVLTHGTLKSFSQCGRYRTPEERIEVVDELESEVVYTPPRAETVDKRMAELISFFNYQDDTRLVHKSPADQYIHPIIRAIIVHFMIGYIHPFYDGNGRMARALFYWHMLRNGYWLTEFLSISQVILESKNSYYEAYLQVEYDELDLTYFLQYHCRALMIAFEKLKAYLERKIRVEHNQHIEAASKHGITARQAQLLSAMRANGAAWTVHQIEGYLNLRRQSARLDVKNLVAKKLAREITLDGRTKAYLAD